MCIDYEYDKLWWKHFPQISKPQYSPCTQNANQNTPLKGQIKAKVDECLEYVYIYDLATESSQFENIFSAISDMATRWLTEIITLFSDKQIRCAL